MLSLFASLIVFSVSIALVTVWRLRRLVRVQADLCSELKTFIREAREESTRLESAINAARSVCVISRPEALAKLEELADPAALSDPQALAQTAAQLPPLPGITSDLFVANQKTVAIARLLEQGHAAPEIARRLSLPLGEIELLLSLRPS